VGKGKGKPDSIKLKSSSQKTGTGSSITVASPTGVTEGDMLIAVVDMRGNLNHKISAPRGWKLIRRDVVSSTLTKAVFVRKAGSAEPSQYRFNFNRKQTTNAIILAFSGVDSASPVVASSKKGTRHSKRVTAPGLTAPSEGGYLVGLYATACRTQTSPPPGMIEHIDFSQRFRTRYYLTSAVTTQVVAGGWTGPRKAKMGCAAANIGQLLLLNPSE
jgi:hypothetical protein